MAATARITLAGAGALITGATGGIGRAIARELGGRGARLILTGRRAEELAQLQDELRARTIACDLADRGEVERLGEAAVAAPVDILVANAALPASGLLVDLSPAEIDRMLDVNLRAPIALARALAPGMIDRGRGHMVFISSLSGKAATPAASLYSATKFGLRGFALGLREDLRRCGIGVSVVTPGFISDAGMYARAGVKLPPGAGTKTPQQVADAVVRAIERNRAELDVAPLPLRVGAAIGSVAPGLAAWGSRVMGSDRIAAEFAERQRGERS
ncbi:MAG TPA: SDR family NAD(P)-dependent oxidoreductase [Solirubrobacteraceae bacterium]|nr:SDR family NAD(P)-dependent oxidoreductase [Solirubrobacteraceae bacterium]